VVVRFYPDSEHQHDQPDSHLNVHLVLRPTIPHPDLSYLFNEDRVTASGIRLKLGRDGGRPVDFLQIDGNVSRERAAELEYEMWKHLPGLCPLGADQFGDYIDRGESRHSDPLALTQLLITYHLLRAYNADAGQKFARPVAALNRLKAAPLEMAASETK
jgi:phosphoribulokinase